MQSSTSRSSRLFVVYQAFLNIKTPTNQEARSWAQLPISTFPEFNELNAQTPVCGFILGKQNLMERRGNTMANVCGTNMTIIVFV